MQERHLFLVGQGHHHNTSVSEVDMRPRGVYWARHLSREGKPIAYAVDSRGREIKRFSVVPWDAEIAVALLQDLLDTADPVVDGALELVE